MHSLKKRVASGKLQGETNHQKEGSLLTVHRPDRDGLFLFLPAQNPAVVSNRARLTENAFCFAGELVGVCNFGHAAFLTKATCGNAFEKLCQICWAVFGWSGHEKVRVIRHHLTGKNLESVLGSDLVEQLSQAICYWSGQNAAAVFGHQVRW